MAIKYYYIDDDPLSTIEETAKGLSIHREILEVIPFQHKKWEDLISFLIENQDNYDGLLLDWGLNRKNEEGDKANFDVEALTQQLRRLSVEKKILKRDFPIILCSAQYEFSKVYDRLLSSHDLFDVIYEKDFFHERRDIVEKEMADLGNSYKDIIELLTSYDTENTLKHLFAIDNLEKVDYRVVDYLRLLINEKKPIHEIARFILTKVVRPAGVMIDKALLSARLGVNLDDEDDKNILMLFEILSSCYYKGVFSKHNRRWWMELIIDWWNENFEMPIGSLSAKERADLLNEKFNLTLNSIRPLENSKSDYFWTICKVTQKPIAISDGILVATPIDKSPWEEDEYFSIMMAVEQDAAKVHPLERDRLKKLKELYTKVRKRNEAE